MQQARYVARKIQAVARGKAWNEKFHYFDKGSMATIGRSKAIAEIGKLKLSGLLAWWAWLVVHLVFLIGFRNRLGVLFDWTYSYFTYQRGVRLITGANLPICVPIEVPRAEKTVGRAAAR
jgi:NADH dehydrogenase